MNSQRFPRISTAVPKQRTIAMDPAAHLRLRKHRQFLLSHYHLPQLHRVVVIRLLDLHMSLDIFIMLPTPTHRTCPDQSHARSPLYLSTFQLHLRRLRLRRDRQLTSLRLRLPRPLEHWVLIVSRTQLPLKGCTARDHGTVILAMMAMLHTVGRILPACRTVHHQ